MLAGSVSVGAGGAPTETWNEAKEVLSCKSVEEHCTVVTPFGNVVPDAGEQVTGRVPSTASTAEAGYVTGLVVVNGAGTVMTGPVVSPTKTLNEPCEEPKLSVAVHETVVVPSAKVEPETGVHEIVGAGGGSTKLIPLTSPEKSTAAPAALVAAAVMTSGTLRIGGRFAKIKSVAPSSVRTPLSSMKTTDTAHGPGWPVTLSGISQEMDSLDTELASTSATPPSV